MIIKQLLNNNVIIAKDKRKEVVVMGTGLGFKAKVGEKVDESKIQKIFTLKDYGNKLSELIEEIPAIYLEITEMIVEYGKEKYNLNFSDSIYLQLTDHIYNAVLHEREGIYLKNPFFAEIVRYYKVEYDVAIEARKIIMDKVGFELSEHETAYIAMHILESSSGQDKKEVEFEVEFVNDSIEFIEAHCSSKEFMKNTFHHNRFLVHLKYFAKRYFGNGEFGSEDEILDETVDKCFAEELCFAKKFAEHIYERYGKEVSRQELNYLALHFKNINLK